MVIAALENVMFKDEILQIIKKLLNIIVQIDWKQFKRS